MIRSMTGYSESRIEQGDFALAFTLRSVNHRFLDLHLRISPGLEFFEPEARHLLKSAVVRGHVEMFLNLERNGAGAVQIDRSILNACLETCRSLGREIGTMSEPDVAGLLRIPGVVTSRRDLPIEKEQLGRLAAEGLAEAIARFNQARAAEGEALSRDMSVRLDRLEQLNREVQKLSGSMPPIFKARIEQRLKELGLTEALDSPRLLQESVALALRADIAEEVTRLFSHVAQAKSALAAGGETGKKLDFLLQEINREANTILSKTADVPGEGKRVADCAVEMKLEAEKIREQAQNIE